MACTLSFIIPAYNVEWCIGRALDSILCLKECLKDIEVLVINDGSNDQTPQIAEKYVSQYPQTVHLISKPNGGHGSAINTGICHITGRYFKVIDADDWIVSQNLPQFIKILQTCWADVVLTPYHRVNIADGTKEIWKMYCPEYERTYNLKELVNSWKEFDRCCMFHGITYRTAFYQKYSYRLPEGIFYEDHEYSAIPFCHAQSIYPVDLYIYQYLVGNNEQSVSNKNRLKRINHLKQVTEDLILYRNAHRKISEAGYAYLSLKIASGIPSYYEVACIIQPNKRKGCQQMKEYNSMLYSMAPDIYSNVKKKAIIYMLLGCLHITPELYQKLHFSKVYSLLRKTYSIEKT